MIKVRSRSPSNRSMSYKLMSRLGFPSTIHSATCSATPPLSIIPFELNANEWNSPLINLSGPTRGLRSIEKDSGPHTVLFTPMSSKHGRSLTEFVMRGLNEFQSMLYSWNWKSSGGVGDTTVGLIS